jgi:uncharacterized protein YfiM (DUF2279 family)
MIMLLLVAALHAAPATGSACSACAVTPACGVPTVARRDPWFGPDKVKHFFVSAFLQSVTYSALRAADGGHRASLAGATVATVGFGLGKELHDRRTVGEFSVRDLIWNGAGAGAATLLLERTRR